MSHKVTAEFRFEVGWVSARSVLVLIAFCLVLFSGYAIGQPMPSQPKESPRQQLANAKLGLFVHYVFGLTQAAPGSSPIANVNDFCDSLDVSNIANMAKTMGAQYVVFTSMHWRMTLLYPSEVWGEIYPDHVCRRDVIGALAQALGSVN